MQKLIDLIKGQFEDNNINITESSIPAELDGFDSLTAFSIIDIIEDVYDVQIEEEDLNKTIKEIFYLVDYD